MAIDGAGAAGYGPAVGAAAALGAAALWAFGSFLFQRALRGAPGASRLTAPAANLFKNASAALVFTVAAIAIGAAPPAASAWGSLAFSGLLGFAIGDALYFAAFSRCGVQLAALCANLIPPLAALLDFALFGRALTAGALAGMGLTIGGILLVVSERPRGQSGAPPPDPRTRRVGLAFASLAALAQAGAIVSGRAGFEGTDVLPGTVARLVGGVAGALAIAVLFGAFARTRRGGAAGPLAELADLARPFRRRALALALVPGSLVGAWINLPLHSLGLANLKPGVSGVLFATTPLFVLPIGLFLGERYGARTAFGTAIAFAGVAVVVRFA